MLFFFFLSCRNQKYEGQSSLVLLPQVVRKPGTDTILTKTRTAPTAGPLTILRHLQFLRSAMANHHTCWDIGYLNCTQPARLDTSSLWPCWASRLEAPLSDFVIFQFFSLSSLQPALSCAHLWPVGTQRKIISNLFHLCLHQAPTWLSLSWCLQPNL